MICGGCFIKKVDGVGIDELYNGRFIGQELVQNKIIKEANLEEDAKKMEQTSEVCIDCFMLPPSGEMIAEGDKVRLDVIREDEKEKYLAVSYEYSYMRRDFEDENSM